MNKLINSLNVEITSENDSYIEGLVHVEIVGFYCEYRDEQFNAEHISEVFRFDKEDRMIDFCPLSIAQYAEPAYDALAYNDEDGIDMSDTYLISREDAMDDLTTEIFEAILDTVSATA